MSTPPPAGVGGSFREDAAGRPPAPSGGRSRRRGWIWAYPCTILGGVASIVANVAHAYLRENPPPGAVISAVFWPAALFLAIEALARIDWPPGKGWGMVRYGGLIPIAAVAAVVSYLHLSGLLRSYQVSWFEAYIGPLAVDGLMVIGTGALIALTGRKRDQGNMIIPDTPAELVDGTELPEAPVSPAPNRWEAVQRLREENPGITQKQAADALGVTPRTLRNWAPKGLQW